MGLVDASDDLDSVVVVMMRVMRMMRVTRTTKDEKMRVMMKFTPKIEIETASVTYLLILLVPVPVVMNATGNGELGRGQKIMRPGSDYHHKQQKL